MSVPVHVSLPNFFYGVGNTPAVCLTGGFSREENIDILLLGCGDVRNILCTLHSRNQLEDRHLNITCCDIEAAITARNIVLFTLLLDDRDGSNTDAIWNIYYHLYLDDRSEALLQRQVEKLRVFSASWDDTHYAPFIKFASIQSLDNVRHIWATYQTNNWSDSEKAEYSTRFKDGIKRTSEWRDTVTEGGVVLTSVRSAAPVGLKAIRPAPFLFDYYWKNGIIHGSRELLGTKHPNPMFASLERDTLIHYGTDPILGFHLAAAFVQLNEDSFLHPQGVDPSECDKMVLVARKQFEQWSKSFRQVINRNIVIRFCVADALAFCHTLQYLRVNRAATCANIYQDPWHHVPLMFDGGDHTAPLSFDVIDTSNLVDNLGTMNLLVAATPLLKEKISSTVLTETLLRHETDVQKAADSLLCGHLPTMALLLGLVPVEYWTNATAASAIDDVLLTSIVQNLYVSTGTKGGHRLRNKVAWKLALSHSSKEPRTSCSIIFNEEELSRLLFQVYLNMFPEESLSHHTLNMDTISSRKPFPQVRYTRASFAIFLHFLSKRLTADWNKTMAKLLTLVRDDRTLSMGANYFAELYLHVQYLGLDPWNHVLQSSQLGTVRLYDATVVSPIDITPPFVCITLKVPRANLHIFTDMKREKLGTPLLRCTLAASAAMAVHVNWLSDFAALQLGFGDIQTSGTKLSREFSIKFIEDRNSWAGNSPLIVSFFAPSLALLVDPIGSRLIFGFQTSSQYSSTYIATQRPELIIYETNLGDQENVFITKYRPNLTGYPAIGSINPQRLKVVRGQPCCINITAHTDSKSSQISSYTAQINYFCKVLRQALADGSYVKRVQVDPFTIKVTIGNSDPGHFVQFPTPILLSRSKTHVGRGSSYIKIETPFLHPLDLKERMDFLFPIFIRAYRPVLWNLHYVNLKSLPRVHLTQKSELDFLVPHLSLVFSRRERDIRDKSMDRRELSSELRIEFKDTLFTMFMRFTGLQGITTRIFVLVHPEQDDHENMHILIIGSCLRFDLVNHTVVLDAAALIPTMELKPRLMGFLDEVKKLEIAAIGVSIEEFKLWKQLMPGFVERGRDWEHKSTCEYASSSRVPLSVEIDKTPICSCSLGTLPSDFVSGIPRWNEVSAYAVRVAIPPCFPSPIVEHIGFDAKLKLPSLDGKTCRMCGRDKAEIGIGLLQCGRCREVEYCSAKCQRKDWQNHRGICNRT